MIEKETLGFSEQNKRWTSFYTYYPDYMCSSGTGIVTFKGPNVFIHNSDTASTPYNQFYTTDYASEIHVVSNTAPSNNKVYLSFSQESDDAWDVEFETPNGQQSSLSASNFDKKENIYYSDIMNDSNSPGGIIEGDRIRDTSLLAKLTLMKNTLTRIFSVNFNAIPSYRSNK